MSLLYSPVYPAYKYQFWKSYFIQMRPYLLFVSGIAGAAGLAMATQEETPVWKIVVTFIPFFFGYGFGQALTDCFQTDTDKLSAPYRPLSKGIISIRSVLMVSISGLLGCAIILWLLHPISFLLSVLAVFGLASYTFIKKNYWFGGPFYNAWIMALLPVMGFFAVSAVNTNVFPFALLSYVALCFFSYANFVLMGYLKDIDADMATGYKTFPVVFGWDKTVLFGDMFAAISIILFYWQGNKNIYEMIFGTAATIIAIRGQSFAHVSESKNETDAVIPIAATVRSFILFHIAILLHFQTSWWLLALAYYALFELTFYLRPCRHQI